MSKILIIEDEEAIADLERDYLELSGFEVEIANRGDVGLEKALNEDYDLIILDLMLPEVDGFDICRQVRQEKNIPIIMVSAKNPWTGTWGRRLYDKTIQPERTGGQGKSSHGAL